MNITEKTLLKVENFINNKNLISNEEKSILIALSGGSDSTALTLILNKLKSNLNINKIALAHYNHKLRGREADRDEEFCRKLAEKLGCKFHLGFRQEDITKGKSKQEFYRNLRYDFFNQIAGEFNYDLIATAHNLDDNIETLLLRLFTGTGVSGITGIPPKNGNIIRPVLCLTKEEIELFLEDNNEKFVFDSSNSKDIYLRNNLRLNVIPKIKDIFPNYSEAVNNFIEIISRENSYMESLVEDIISKVLIEKKDTIILLSKNLKKYHRALIYRILKYISDKYGYQLSLPNFNEIVSSLEKDIKGTYEILHTAKVRVVNEYGNILFLRDFKNGVNEETVVFDANETVKWKQFNISTKIISIDEFKDSDLRNENKLFFDINKLSLPLKVRSFKNGDRIKIKNQSKGKKLKEIFINNKVPLLRKRDVCVICDSQEIIGVYYRINGDSFVNRTSINTYINNQTKQILIIEISLV